MPKQLSSEIQRGGPHPIVLKSPNGVDRIRLISKACRSISDKVYCILYPLRQDEAKHAKVAELVDALALGASGATRESSNLSFRTIDQGTQQELSFIGDPAGCAASDRSKKTVGAFPINAIFECLTQRL